MKACEWCGEPEALPGTNTVYWELPDGTRAIELTNTPAMICSSCGMAYQEDSTIKDIEDQLFLINTKKLPESLTYQQLMETERILKRNYFDFS
ncbi:YokU family protein [Bacillus mojavensis]|uniref:YokU family protein n=1 Tax=Bacillus mojavensis TaxID=72360 RepID=UPI002DBF2D6E|nr:YokU family protein [Bacillus mojavensis]MEC1622107.1 YokU family protein [Bacillus mojavensis]MEC1660460.1 YokU family protein [Bacillus mojavensis]MEC1684549.1 YokU family protein [Bacillus mojavensis]MEC1706610.1 YokU family protein [Bacillus mojavensis]MEC1734075.1 YokU family protein [Bacillus mojavensis]